MNNYKERIGSMADDHETISARDGGDFQEGTNKLHYN